MEIFYFCRGLLAWMATVAICLPISIPMAAAAYKIRLGAKELDIDTDELWYRSFLAAFILALVSAGFLLLDWLVVDTLDFPSGIIHMVMVMAYVPTGAWMMTYYFGFSDMLDGLSTFTIFIALPLFVLWLIHAATGWWDLPLGWAYEWLRPVEDTIPGLPR